MALFDTVDAILLGRGTYEDLVRKWPPMKDAPGLDEVSRRLADKINNAAKFVVTHDDRPGELTWGEFPAAQRLSGNDVRYSSIRAASAGLIVHPVVVTVGEQLFDGLPAESAALKSLERAPGRGVESEQRCS